MDNRLVIVLVTNAWMYYVTCEKAYVHDVNAVLQRVFSVKIGSQILKFFQKCSMHEQRNQIQGRAKKFLHV